MKVKRFVCDSISEACEKIEGELGSDAMILQTARIKVGGFLGLFGSWKYEVFAGQIQSGPADALSRLGPGTGISPCETLTAEFGLDPDEECPSRSGSEFDFLDDWESGASIDPATTIARRSGFSTRTEFRDSSSVPSNSGTLPTGMGFPPPGCGPQLSRPPLMSETSDTLNAFDAEKPFRTSVTLRSTSASSRRTLKLPLDRFVDTPRDPVPTAARQEEFPNVQRISSPELEQIREEISELKKLLGGITKPVGDVGSPAPSRLENVGTEPAPELSSSHRAIGSSRDRGHQRGRSVFENLVELLIQAEVSASLIERIRGHLLGSATPEELGDLGRLKDLVVEFLSSSMATQHGVEITRGGRPRIIAMVGPTGVGKTTSLAKLGAGLKFNKGYNVGFITIDTFRIAAPEQLKKYAEILDVPVEVVFEPHRIPDAIESLKDKDVILIDTAGRNPKNRPDLEDLGSFLDFGLPVETYLVLSATTKFTDLLDTIRRFKEVNFSKLIFTKLDETENFGSMISALEQIQHSISYVTTGQNVPDDIRPADARSIARLIFERSLDAAEPVALAG